MGYRRVRARSAKAARKNATTKHMTVTKVNYIKGSKKGGMKSYGVYTREKLRGKHTTRGWAQDRERNSQQEWEKRYRRKK